MVVLPNVKTFDNVSADKKQVLKIAEETLEVFSAWEDIGRIGLVHGAFSLREAEHDLLDECADVIQATCNLIASLGVDDFTPYMEACEERNRERGRL